MTRYKQGLNVKNPLLWEIKRFYKEEYSIGIQAIEIIKDRLGVNLQEDEAASIALHIVNAQLNSDMPNVVNMTKIIQEILSIIRYYFRIEFDEESLTYHRLVTHLKFFAQRMLNNKLSRSNDDYLYHIVKKKHVDAYKCAEKIKTHIKKSYDFTITNEEMTYLIIHIQRVVSRESEK
ncbi:hypothetical protein CPJCM30710_23810 [Clostridium polyendosporum]|uniref:PRD domain-containing protein n=1 Tax=Clostridium polyendosporum TaxID=69208 RepID=A0A919VGU0_9CLOT|nr:hypothetical protein CPJCM30710_23810 [Clostridium polyendosporum]